MVGSRLPFHAYIYKYTSVTGPITVYAKGCCAHVCVLFHFIAVFSRQQKTMKYYAVSATRFIYINYHCGACNTSTDENCRVRGRMDHGDLDRQRVLRLKKKKLGRIILLVFDYFLNLF